MIGAALVWVAYYGQFLAHLTDREIVGGPGAQATRPRPSRPRRPAPARCSASSPPAPRSGTSCRTSPPRSSAPSCWCSPILTQGLNDSGNGLGTLGALITAFVVVAIGLSLGGPTGYAINPARDLGPRIVHALLPLPNKGGSDWSYAWIPVVGPLIGGAIAAGIYNVAFA